MRRKLVLLAGLLLVPFLAAPAQAQVGYNGVTVTVNRTNVVEGATVRVTAEGFDPGTDFDVLVNGVFINDATVRRNGRGSILIDLPRGVTGEVTITVRGSANNTEATASTLINVSPRHGTTTTTTTAVTSTTTTTAPSTSTTTTTAPTTTTTQNPIVTFLVKLLKFLLCVFFGLC